MFPESSKKFSVMKFTDSSIQFSKSDLIPFHSCIIDIVSYQPWIVADFGIYVGIIIPYKHLKNQKTMNHSDCLGEER